MMTSNLRTSALFALLALLLAGLAACGGDDDDDGPVLPGFNDDSNGGSGDDNGNGDDDGDDDDFDFGEGMAVVTIDGNTYEFDLTAGFTVCREVFGIIQVDGSTSDDGARVAMEIPPTNWESYDDGRYDPPSVQVSDDVENVVWLAGPSDVRDLPEGMSQVDNYEKDGLRASGSATFIEIRAFDSGSTVTAQGTFEVSCEE